MIKRLFTSESVTEGHPDKICDQISDAILDAILEEDPNGRVACETVVSTGLVLVTGEITTNAYIDIQKVVRDTIRNIGYTHSEHNLNSNFDADGVSVLISIDEQSSDIAQGVDKALEYRSEDIEPNIGLTGSGDQGLMFGYATNETEEFMPLPITLANKLALRLSEVRKEGILNYLGPDGKTQVTIEYDENDNPIRVDTIVISTQHSEHVSSKKINQDIKKYVIKEVVPKSLLDGDTKYFINPTGKFVIGGPNGDAGLTGRKIIVDTYGGFARHGGGAFSGKDPTKVDRSGAYVARYIAKNIVAAGLADKCEIQLSYAIGVAEPVSISVNTFGSSKVSEESLIQLIYKNFDLRPAGIIQMLDLKRPIYKKTSAYGHFGRNEPEFTWERLDKVTDLLEESKSYFQK